MGGIRDAVLPRPPAVSHERDDRRRAGARRAPHPSPVHRRDGRAARLGHPRGGGRGPSHRHDRLWHLRARRDGRRRAAQRGARPAGRSRRALDPGPRAARPSDRRRARHRHLARGRHAHHQRGAPHGARVGRTDRPHHRGRRIAGRRVGRARDSHRGAGPELVPHRRLPLAAPGRRRARRASVAIEGRRRSPSAPCSTWPTIRTPPHRWHRRSPASIG